MKLCARGKKNFGRVQGKSNSFSPSEYEKASQKKAAIMCELDPTKMCPRCDTDPWTGRMAVGV